MRRHNLALRAVTTSKVSDVPIIDAVQEEFRYQLRELLSDPARQANIFNMDETAIFYDMHHQRTIDFKGNRTVPAHRTKKADNRVTVVVWVSAAGVVGPPLIVHARPAAKGQVTTERSRADRAKAALFKNKPQRRVVRIPVYQRHQEDEVVEES
jgi:hypothetical protein